MQFQQVEEQVVVHEPEVGKVRGLRLLSLERVPEEVVKQLIAFLVEAEGQLRRIHQLHNLHKNSLLNLLEFRLLLFLKLHGQALLHTKRGLPINLLKLCPLGDLLTPIEEDPLALAELLLEDELAGDEHLAGDDDAEEGALAEHVPALAHQLVQLQDFLLDAVEQSVVLALPHLLVPEEVTVKLLQEREEVLPELVQFFVHLGPEEDVAAAEAHQLAVVVVLRLGAVSKAVLPLRLLVEVEEAVVDDIVDDLVLIIEFSLRGLQQEGLGLRIRDLLKKVGHL